jgi:hypothetical protein
VNKQVLFLLLYSQKYKILAKGPMTFVATTWV